MWLWIWLQVIITFTAVNTHTVNCHHNSEKYQPQKDLAKEVWEGVSTVSLAASSMKRVVKGYSCAAVCFFVCVCVDACVCLLVSGVRLANTLSSSCGYYAHIQSIWHNHRSHLLWYLSLGNLRAQTTAFWVFVCECVCLLWEVIRSVPIQSDRDWIELAGCCCGCQWRPVVDTKGWKKGKTHRQWHSEFKCGLSITETIFRDKCHFSLLFSSMPFSPLPLFMIYNPISKSFLLSVHVWMCVCVCTLWSSQLVHSASSSPPQ